MGTRFFERFCHFREGFIDLMQRGPREHESRYLQCTLQRPGDLTYNPHLLAHAVLTLDHQLVHQRFYPDGTPLLLQIHILYFKLLMGILSVCLVVGGAKLCVEKVYQPYVNGWFPPATGPRESKDTKTLKILGATKS